MTEPTPAPIPDPTVAEALDMAAAFTHEKKYKDALECLGSAVLQLAEAVDTLQAAFLELRESVTPKL